MNKLVLFLNDWNSNYFTKTPVSQSCLQQPCHIWDEGLYNSNNSRLEAVNHCHKEFHHCNRVRGSASVYKYWIRLWFLNIKVSPEVFYKKVFLIISQNSQENTYFRVSFLIKLYFSRMTIICTLIASEVLKYCFTVYHCHVWTKYIIPKTFKIAWLPKYRSNLTKKFNLFL